MVGRRQRSPSFANFLNVLPTMNIIFDPAKTLINDGNDNKELYIIFSMLALYTCHSSYSVKQGTSIIVCFRNCMSFGRPTLNSGRCILTG